MQMEVDLTDQQRKTYNVAAHLWFVWLGVCWSASVLLS